jgi:hypothetical protein
MYHVHVKAVGGGRDWQRRWARAEDKGGSERRQMTRKRDQRRGVKNRQIKRDHQMLVSPRQTSLVPRVAEKQREDDKNGRMGKLVY